MFDSAVRLAVESPWERIRAIDARTTTPLGLALRGRFLTGSRPVSADIVRRFVSCAADNGIDIFRLHDPLNDVSNLLEAGEAILAAGKEFHVGLVYSAGREGEIDALVERAKQLPALGATRVILNDPTDALLPHLTEELVQRIGEETGLPVGLFVQGAAGTGLLNAVVATRVGADLIATAIYPLALTLHRVSGRVARRRAPRPRPRDRRRHGAAVGGLRSRRRAHRRPARRTRRAAHRRSRCRVRPARPASSPRSTSICARTPPAIACSTR